MKERAIMGPQPCLPDIGLIPIAPPTLASSRYWSAAQYMGVGLTAALLVALVLQPAAALHVLWDMTIPVLPAVFLVNPMLWRNVCPLATLNTISGGPVGTRLLDARSARVAWIMGIVLLFALVPARRFLFNSNGPVLALTIFAVAALAIASGLVFARRAGFCNAICPVLPVEKLYGQTPLIQVGNPRCADCSLCTAIGCIDLAATKTVAQTIGPARRDRRWVLTPFGIFAAAFPGFIVAFFALDDGPVSTALTVYATVVAYSLVSYVAIAAIAILGRVGPTTLMPLLGAAAFSLYYWFSAPTLAEAYGSRDIGPIVIRIAAGVLLVVWLTRVWRSARANGTIVKSR
jgi:hypothetical protein